MNIFKIPVTYLLDEQIMQIIDKQLWQTICDVAGCAREGDEFADRNDVSKESLLTFIEQEFPDTDVSLENGVLDVGFYDYYDYDLDPIFKYCMENNIPVDVFITPDSSESRYCEFYRPGQDRRMVDINDYYHPVYPIHIIQNMINNAEETKTDTDIMLEISEKLEFVSPNSSLNTLKNWV